MPRGKRTLASHAASIQTKCRPGLHDTPPMPASRSLLHTALREPTLHFFAIAACLFALYAFGQRNQENLLQIDQSDIDARIFLQEMSSGQELNEEQRQFVTARYIEDRILVEEALAMDLDDDARIHDILAQKMRHILSGEIIQPSPAELQAYFAAHAERYRTLATVNTDELVFDSREPLPAAVLARLQAGAAADELLALSPGSVAPLPNVNPVDLANIFSPDFADRVFAAALDTWLGPFPSNRGQHWLRVRERHDAGIPALETIADRVRLDWIADEEESRLQAEVDKLWERYTIVINGVED